MHTTCVLEGSQGVARVGVGLRVAGGEVVLPEGIKLWGRSATCDLVCWHFARILHKLKRFMGQPLRLDSLETAAEKGVGRETGAEGKRGEHNHSSWNMI